MRGFGPTLSGEYKKHLYRINMIAWLILLGILLFQANLTVNELKQIHGKTDAFKKIQNFQFKTVTSYAIYQTFGINILFIIPSTAVISNDTTIPNDLSSKFDSFANLKMLKNFKDKSLASQGKGIQPTIALIIKWLISLLALGYGLKSFPNRGYTRFTAGLWGHLRSFIYTILSRFLLFFLTFLTVMALVFFFILVRGIVFSPGDLAIIAAFLLEAVIYLGLFFFLGASIGLLVKNEMVFLLLFLAWFIINIPGYWIIKPAVEPGFPDALKDYQTVVDKMKIFKDFEAYAEKRYGKFDRNDMETGRKAIEDFWNNYYLKKIAPMEKQLRDMIARSIARDRRLSKFFPGLFFDMTANEAAGRGYENYLRFYDYTMEMKAKFVRFIIDRAFYNDPKVMVNFIQGDEDLFYGKGTLPPNYWAGIFIQLAYLAILIIFCYACYIWKVFPRPNNADAFDQLALDLRSGESFTLRDHTDDDTLRTQLGNKFLGKSRDLPWKLTLDGKPFPTGKKHWILFILNLGDIPAELKGKHLVIFFKRVFKLSGRDLAQLENEIGKETLDKHFNKMKKVEKVKLVLSLFFLVKYPIYFFDNFTGDIPGGLSLLIEDLVNKKLPAGSMIIDLNATDRRNNQLNWLAVHFKDGKYQLFVPKE